MRRSFLVVTTAFVTRVKKRENETPRGKVPVSVVFSQFIFINLQYKGTLVRN